MSSSDSTETPATPPLGFNAKFAYGVGQTAEGVKNATFAMFVLFYYNQVLELPATLAGLALFIALVFDAITDPLAGSISDNWRSRMGRRHPFMYASAVPLGIAFFLLFLPPDGMSEFGLFAWMTTFVVLTRASMTLYHVPHLALGAELSEDYHERTRIVSIRYFMNFVGYLLAYYLGFGLFFADTPEFPRGQFNVDAYAPFALVLSIIMAITILWSAWGTHNRIPFLPIANDELNQAKQTFKAIFIRTFTEMWQALQNRSFAWAFGGSMVIFIMVGTDSALNLYMFEFFWGLMSDQKLVLMLLYPLGIMAGTALVPFLHRKVDKRHGMTIGITGWATCQIIPIFLRFYGLLPENGTTELATILTAIKFIQGIFAAQSLVSFHSMIADIADQHELTTNKRQEGIFFAAGSFATKTTSGLGSFLAGIGLDIIQWPTGIDAGSDIPAETLANLAMMYGPIVSGFAVVSVLLIIQCKMTRAEHEAVQAKLAEVRAAN